MVFTLLFRNTERDIAENPGPLSMLCQPRNKENFYDRVETFSVSFLTLDCSLSIRVFFRVFPWVRFLQRRLSLDELQRI